MLRIFLLAFVLFAPSLLAPLGSLEICEDGSEVFHCYSTVADDRHYPLLRNLIASIHRIDFDLLDEIAVFDIGLTAGQRRTIANIQKVKVYDVEKTHPDLFRYFVTNPWNKQVRGWFAWKPVVLKQSLEMFPYLLYLDAGTLLLTSPNDLFKHISQNGYFLLSVSHNIIDRLTEPVRAKVVSKMSEEQQAIVLHPDTWMVAGGIQGVSQAVLQPYILPIYQLSSRLYLFADDGSAPLGFGAGRHDQTLFSIYARALRLHANNGEGWSDLTVDGKQVPFHYHWDRNSVNEKTCLYTCRFETSLADESFIRWRD